MTKFQIYKGQREIITTTVFKKTKPTQFNSANSIIWHKDVIIWEGRRLEMLSNYNSMW